jgi:hypothetical protein
MQFRPDELGDVASPAQIGSERWPAQVEIPVLGPEIFAGLEHDHGSVRVPERHHEWRRRLTNTDGSEA